MVSWMVSWWFRDGFVNLRNQPRNHHFPFENLRNHEIGACGIKYYIPASAQNWFRGIVCMHSWLFRRFRDGFVMVSYGFGRFRPVFVGSGPHFLEKRVQEIKSFFFQFSTFFHIKKKIFENLCKIFSKNIFEKLLIFCRRKKIVCDVCDNMYVTFICCFQKCVVFHLGYGNTASTPRVRSVHLKRRLSRLLIL